MKKKQVIYSVSAAVYKPTPQVDLLTVDTKETYKVEQGIMRAYEHEKGNREKHNRH